MEDPTNRGPPTSVNVERDTEEQKMKRVSGILLAAVLAFAVSTVVPVPAAAQAGQATQAKDSTKKGKSKMAGKKGEKKGAMKADSTKKKM